MSIFSKWIYQFLKLYNVGVIFYEVKIKKRLTEKYQSIYMNSIIEIAKYDTHQLTKEYIVQTKPYDVIKHALAIHKGDTSFKTNSFHPSHTNSDPLYQITCWDNKKYLTRKTYSIENRPVSGKRHICLHASINDHLDITDFINQHPESFTAENHITLLDILCIYLINNNIHYDVFHKILLDSNIYMYVIDDETLEVRTFKDNQDIIL